MRRNTALAAALVLGMSLAGADVELSSPGFAASTVEADGAIAEPWGKVRLSLDGAPAPQQSLQESPFPAAITSAKAGPVSLVQTAWRAPIWPGGVDVLLARIENTSEQPANARLVLETPEDLSLGERVGVCQGRPVLALPEGRTPERQENAWGCTGGVTKLPGWGHPEGECDPAFSNISAGMGGVPITYRFAVPPGAKRLVVLGFCESHHPTAGQRPLVLQVEGAAGREVDPIAEWGQHGAGCVAFDAEDADRDGKIDLAVLPHPRAPDKNTILNVAWVFEAGPRDMAKVMRGALNDAAEYYVDVGGEKDQMLYKGGEIAYTVPLEPGASEEMLFLIGSPGAGPVPDPEHTAWDAAALRKAAEDVWCARKASVAK